MIQWRFKKKNEPLKFDKKANHVRISDLTARVNLIKCCGRVIPTVKSMSRPKNARPGRTTQQAKFSNPIRDCNSRRVTFLRFKKSDTQQLRCRCAYFNLSHYYVFGARTLTPSVITVLGARTLTCSLLRFWCAHLNSFRY